jgi:hypothetical protein
MARERKTRRSQVRQRRPGRRPTRVKNMSIKMASHQGLQAFGHELQLYKVIGRNAPVKRSEVTEPAQGASDRSLCELINSATRRYGPGSLRNNCRREIYISPRSKAVQTAH